MATANPEATAVIINRFDDFIKENSTKKLGDAETTLAQIRKCKNINPSVFEPKKVAAFLTERAKTVAALVGKYLTARMTVKYPILADELFKMKRHLTVTKGGVITSDRISPLEKGNNKDIRVTCPLFAEVPIGGPYTVEIGSWNKKTSRMMNSYGDREYKTHSGSIKATLPEPSLEIKSLGRMAIGYYYNIVGEMYQDADLSEVLPTEPRTPQLSIIWIPSPKALGLKIEKSVKVVKGPRPEPVMIPKYNDPALLLAVGNLKFVVKTYDIEDEEPLVNLLREFSTGGKFE